VAAGGTAVTTAEAWLVGKAAAHGYGCCLHHGHGGERRFGHRCCFCEHAVEFGAEAGKDLFITPCRLAGHIADFGNIGHHAVAGIVDGHG